MKEHLKKALTALKVRHYVIIVLALLVIIYGALVLLDVVETESRVTRLVSAAQPDDKFVLSKDARFENSVLEFLSVDKLCAVTSEQAEALKSSYTMEEREYYIASQAKTVFVLYVDGPRTNLQQLEKQVGTIDDGDCEVVRGTKVIALLAPAN